MPYVDVNVPEAEHMTKLMERMWDKIRASMELHQKEEKEVQVKYNVGDKVYLVTSNIKTQSPMKKLDSKKIGPYPITEVISSHAYRVGLPKTMKIHYVFHVNLLKPFKEDTDFHRRQIRPPPVITEEGEEEYKVEKIVAWKQTKKGLLYQVRWRGYGPEEDTMERAEKISVLDEVMGTFLAEYPAAPVPKGYKGGWSNVPNLHQLSTYYYSNHRNSTNNTNNKS